MATFRCTGTIIGASPLLQSCKTHQHPSDPLRRLAKPLSSKAKKSEEDFISLAKLDFIASTHWLDTSAGEVEILPNGDVTFAGYARPYVPGDMLRASLKESSRALKNRLGAAFDRGVQILDDFELRYEGPKDCVGMWNAGLYRNDGACRNGGKLVWVTRVAIPVGWEIDFELYADSSQIELSDLQLMIQGAGRYVGMGAWRPTCGGRFGRFTLGDFNAEEVEL